MSALRLRLLLAQSIIDDYMHRYMRTGTRGGARRRYLVHGRHYADVRRGHQDAAGDGVDPPGLVNGPGRELDHGHGAGCER
jgi:hypothetical protein